MRKYTYISGLFAALLLLISAIIKIISLPIYTLSNITLISGISLICIVYLPLLYIDKMKDVESKREKLHYTTGIISAFLIISGVLFRLMDWNPGRLILYSGVFIFGIFTCIMFVISHKETNIIKKYNILNSIIFFIIIATLFSIFYNNRVGKKVFSGFNVIDNNILETNIKLGKNIDFVLKQFKEINDKDNSKLTNYNNALKVSGQSDDLVLFINNLRSELITSTGNVSKESYPKLRISEINSVENYNKPMKILIGVKKNDWNGKGKVLKNKINDYTINIKKILSKKDRNLICLCINTEDKILNNHNKKVSWEWNNFINSTLAADIVILDNLISDIRYTEYQAITYLYMHSTHNELNNE
ncbi:MAG: hypothetical protein Q8880_07555 [Bacteroidota bacterium]|nr:hypothetical protein [Bacteroidota bacterium]